MLKNAPSPSIRPFAAAAVIVIASSMLAPTARADVYREVELSQARSETTWEATVPEGTVPDPALCTAATCSITDIFLHEATERLVVAVDTSQMENTFDFLYDIQLHLYSPDGRLAASDDSSFESNVVVVEEAEAGRWKAVVLPDAVVGELRYRAYTAATTRPRPKPPMVDLLPNLVPQPPRNITLATAPAAGPPPFTWDFRHQSSGPSSCYAQEMIELGARRCLRFDQTIANLGDGPLELRARQQGDGPMDQRVHRSDGTTRDRDVGDVRFHLQHLHFHYEDYARVRLYQLDADRPGGAAYRSTRSVGPLVREGRKQGFCLADTTNMRFGRPDQTAADYLDPLPCDGRNEAPAYSRVGLSAGWADTYPWYIPEQFLEISGIPDGPYLLEFSVNEARAIEEATYRDNAVGIVIELTGDSVTVADDQPWIKPHPGANL